MNEEKSKEIDRQLDKIQASLNHSDIEEMDYKQEVSFLETILQRLITINKLLDEE